MLFKIKNIDFYSELTIIFFYKPKCEFSRFAVYWIQKKTETKYLGMRMYKVS